MKLAAAPRTRAAGVALGLVLLAGLVFAVRGCATSEAVPSSATPAGALSLAAARQIFDTFVTTDDVARAASNESLALSLVANARVPLTVAAYESAAYFGTPVPRYVYGTPKLYVPQMTGFPFWFAAVADRAPASGGPAHTVIMVFTRPAAGDSWRLSVSTTLLPGATMPRIAVDGTGHATALATFDHNLLVTPNTTGALQSTVVVLGSDANAASMIAPGSYTTGLHEEILTTKHREVRAGFAYDSVLDGTTFPLYALRTADGGGLVMYSMNRDTVILRKRQQGQQGQQDQQGRQIEIPPPFAPVLDAADNLVIRFELDTTQTFQFATEVPPARSAAGIRPMMRVVAADGAPTAAGGS